MKKFIRILVLAILALSILSSVACNNTGNGGGNGGSSTISETEWTAISDNAFVVETLGHVAIRANANSYEKYSVSLNSADLESAYINGAYKVAKEGGEWNAMQSIDAETYNYNVAGIKAVIDFVKNNKTSFTFSNDKYTATITDSALLEAILQVAEVLERPVFSPQSLQVEKIYIQTKDQNKSALRITIVDEKGGLSNIVITLQNSVLQYDLDKEVNRLTTFAIKGGPSLDDVDYVEIYFTQDGFRKQP